MKSLLLSCFVLFIGKMVSKCHILTFFVVVKLAMMMYNKLD